MLQAILTPAEFDRYLAATLASVLARPHPDEAESLFIRCPNASCGVVRVCATGWRRLSFFAFLHFSNRALFAPNLLQIMEVVASPVVTPQSPSTTPMTTPLAAEPPVPPRVVLTVAPQRSRARSGHSHLISRVRSKLLGWLTRARVVNTGRLRSGEPVDGGAPSDARHHDGTLLSASSHDIFLVPLLSPFTRNPSAALALFVARSPHMTS